MMQQDDSIFESGVENLQKFQKFFATIITASCLFNDAIVFILLRGLNCLDYFIVYCSIYIIDKLLFIYFEKPNLTLLLSEMLDLGLFFRYKKNVIIKMVVRVILMQYIQICLVLSRDDYYRKSDLPIQICLLVSFFVHLIIITARINVIFFIEDFGNENNYTEVYTIDMQDQNQNNIQNIQQNMIQQNQHQEMNTNNQVINDYQQLNVVESTSSLSSNVTPLLKKSNKTTKTSTCFKFKLYMPSFRSAVSFVGRLSYQLCFQLLLVLLLNQSFINSLIYIISKMLILFIINRIALYYQQGPTFNYLILILAQFFYIVIDHGPFYQFYISPYKVSNNERLLYSSSIFQINSLYQLVDVTSIFLMDYFITDFDANQKLQQNQTDEGNNLQIKIQFYLRFIAYIILGVCQLCYLINISLRLISFCSRKYRIYSSKRSNLKKIVQILSNSSSLQYMYANIQTQDMQIQQVGHQNSLIFGNDAVNSQDISSLTLNSLNSISNQNKYNKNSTSLNQCFKIITRKKYFEGAYIEIQQDFTTVILLENNCIILTPLYKI
ncbi:transmembrane protein, putative (macronuclear) [Tetrahymena thermophila SB210]|uniref:Transmembrane protein, putative n=1 Tax=Tetrahymena thermophila (strain SB210) TaxID=312017 RepID=Q22UU8_TETTS|nr:transmembrane protein, putative [Tetrahymena thermophila SB210]EAR89028.1 transmembrane protein, putative [Tetrahymena thermophila SB210]|eukprot:XP_001009273.1 transmembrane protein, putative [Tetrahymena thermophila SB210]